MPEVALPPDLPFVLLYAGKRLSGGIGSRLVARRRPSAAWQSWPRRRSSRTGGATYGAMASLFLAAGSCVARFARASPWPVWLWRRRSRGSWTRPSTGGVAFEREVVVADADSPEAIAAVQAESCGAKENKAARDIVLGNWGGAAGGGASGPP